jgi:UDP-arabinose 4-epimerase
MAIVVTGGAGYIGSHTTKYLADQGLEPVVVDNLTTGHRPAVQQWPLIECDIADRDILLKVFDEYSVDSVIHFAASCYVGESMAHPSEYFRNNVTNTLSLLGTMREAGVKNFVFSSTCATYGILAYTPITEDSPQLPVNPYGESKLFVERALKWYGTAYGLRWVALRYFNAAGADPDGQVGEWHDPETHLVPLAILAALGAGAELSIYGSDFPTPDGSAIRDYVHVSDLASAHLRALEYLHAGGTISAFNLGTGRGHSVFEVVKAVEAATGRPVPARVAKRRAGDPPVLVADPRRAQDVLGWVPQHSTLDEIIETAYRWHKSKTVSIVES